MLYLNFKWTLTRNCVLLTDFQRFFLFSNILFITEDIPLPLAYWNLIVIYLAQEQEIGMNSSLRVTAFLVSNLP